jgi:dTMP kinase
MNERGMLVAVVGADGAGKTTASMRLVKELSAAGYPARYLDRWDIVGNPAYPSASFLMHDVPQIRTCVAAMPLPARLLFLLWTMSLVLSADQEQHRVAGIRVMDAYWMKHVASEVAYGLSADWSLAVAAALPTPDLVLHLRLTPELAWSRKQSNLVPYECGMDPSCSRQGFLAHQGRIAHLLDEWSERFGWMCIDASAPLESVVGILKAHILSAARASASREPGGQADLTASQNS